MTLSGRQTARRRTLLIAAPVWTGLLVVGLAVSVALAVVWYVPKEGPRDEPYPQFRTGRMVHVPGGTFRMGDDFSLHPDERPAHEVVVASFWMDEHEVTNRQFAEFVAQTGYITTAEARGWAFVFDRGAGQWVKRAGADWRHPGGPDTRLIGRDDYPVVQVSWYDAQAYAKWAKKRLPSEAEWEHAARAGLRDAHFPWGSDELVDGKYRANYWQGWFPDEDLAADGFDTLAPVKSFGPNRFGLYDVSGNVWEWCRDWYSEDYYADSLREDPRGPVECEMRVQRGGSWLSAENHCPGYKVTTRSKRPPEVCYQDVGFRCVGDGRQKRY